jgi:hypothetical protein
VSSTIRRPASVSWRRAIEASSPDRRCRPESTATVVPLAAGRDLAAEQRGDADGAGTLDHELAALHQHDHRRGGLVLADDHDVVDPAAEQLQGEVAGALDGDPVGDGQCGGGRHGLAAAQRLRVRRAGGDLDADHLDVRLGALDRDRHAGAQPAAADGHDDLGQVRHVLEQFEAERALTGDDVGIVERVHEREAALLGPGPRGREALVDRPAALVDDRSLSARGLDLGERGVGGHEHLADDAAIAGGGGQRLGVVAGRSGHDAVRAALLPQRGQLGRDAAHLERTGALEVLGLERDHAPRALGDGARGEQWRAPRDGLRGRPCGGDVFRGYRGRRGGAHQSGSATMASISTSAPSGSDATPIVVRGGGLGLEVGAVGLVDVLEDGDVGDVDRHPHGVGELGARCGRDDGQVLQAPAGLIADRALDQLARIGIQGCLARAEHEPVGDDGVGVRTGRVGSADRGDRFAMVRHVGNLR